MTPQKNETRPGKGRDFAEQMQQERDGFDIATMPQHDHAVRGENAENEKAAAVALYVHGILPLERVQSLFDLHPEWRCA